MARPERNNVDYFPFICEDGNKMFYIEETYGNDGFATFVKLLRELAKTNYHYLDLSKPTTIMFLSAKCKVSKETLLSIIKDCVELGKFDAILWNENSVIWCQDFIDSIQDAYSKRNNKCITYDGLLQLLISLGVRKPIKSIPTVPVNPQSIVEYSIEDNNKEDNIKTTPFSFFNSLLNLGADKQLTNDWLKVRKTKKATNTETALNKFINQVEKSGYTLNEVLEKCIEKSWSGFDADWYKKEAKPQRKFTPLI